MLFDARALLKKDRFGISVIEIRDVVGGLFGFFPQGGFGDGQKCPQMVLVTHQFFRKIEIFWISKFSKFQNFQKFWKNFLEKNLEKHFSAKIFFGKKTFFCKKIFGKKDLENCYKNRRFSFRILIFLLQSSIFPLFEAPLAPQKCPQGGCGAQKNPPPGVWAPSLWPRAPYNIFDLVPLPNAETQASRGPIPSRSSGSPRKLSSTSGQSH